MAKVDRPDYLQKLVTNLAALLVGANESEISRRPLVVTAAIGQLSGGHLALAALPHPRAAAEPLPCRFSTPELVELLKQPTCVGPARRLILDQLENRYGRKFIDQWAFVRYAQEQGLGLDFTSPPQRFALGAKNPGP